MKECPSCHAQVVDEAKFCNKCGFNIKASQEQSAFCIECGAKLQKDSIFCIECGKQQPQNENSINSFDFSSLQAEAQNQLAEKEKEARDFVVQNGVLVKYLGIDENVEIPDTVEIIGGSSFGDWQRPNKIVKKIIIPSSVTKIDERAFNECKSLISINIPNSVTDILERAFVGCSSLIDVKIPSSVTSIGKMAFCGCTSLTSIEILNNKTSIDFGAFGNCTGLKIIKLPKECKSISDSGWNFDCPAEIIYY